MFMVDRERSVAIVRNGGVVTRHLRFDGKILAGLRVIFWGNIEAKDVYLGKGCVVMGRITCDRAVIGACTRFNEIFADEVLIQGRCLGRYVKARNVHIAEGCMIGEVEADEKIVIDGNSKLGKLNAKKILASSEGGGGET